MFQFCSKSGLVPYTISFFLYVLVQSPAMGLWTCLVELLIVVTMLMCHQQWSALSPAEIQDGLQVVIPSPALLRLLNSIYAFETAHKHHCQLSNESF